MRMLDVHLLLRLEADAPASQLDTGAVKQRVLSQTVSQSKTDGSEAYSLGAHDLGFVSRTYRIALQSSYPMF